MKAKIVTQTFHDGATDFIRGGVGSSIKRLWVEEADNLAITPDGDVVHAIIGFNPTGTKSIGEVENRHCLSQKA